MEFENYDSILSSLQDDNLKDQTVSLSDIAIKTEPADFISPSYGGSSLSPSYSSGSSPEDLLFNPDYYNSGLWDMPELSKNNTTVSGVSDMQREEAPIKVETEMEPISRPRKKVKSSHNMVEKKYRTNINSKILELRNSVPALRIVISKNLKDGKISKSSDDDEMDDEYEGGGYQDDLSKLDGLTPAKKLNKATILAKATEYIKHLEWKNSLLEEQVQKLKKELDDRSMDLYSSMDSQQRATTQNNQSSATNKMLLAGMACFIGASAYDDFDSSNSRHGLFALPILSIGDSTQTNLLRPMFGMLKVLFVSSVVWFYVLYPLLSTPTKKTTPLYRLVYQLVTCNDPVLQLQSLVALKQDLLLSLLGPKLWASIPRDHFPEHIQFLLSNFQVSEVALHTTGDFEQLASLKSQQLFNDVLNEMINGHGAEIDRSALLSQLAASIRLQNTQDSSFMKHLIRCSILANLLNPAKDTIARSVRLVSQNTRSVDQTMLMCLVCSIINFHFKSGKPELAMQWFENLQVPHYSETMEPMGFVSLLYIVDDIPIVRASESPVESDADSDYTLSQSNFKMLNILGNMRIFIGDRSEHECDLRLKNQMVESFVSKLELINGF